RFEPLLAIAKQHLEDDWFQSGIALSIVNNPVSWLEEIQAIETEQTAEAPGKENFIETIASIIGSRQNGVEVARLLSKLGKSGFNDSLYTVAGLRGLRSGLQQGSLPYSLSSAAESDLLKMISADANGIHKSAMELSSLIMLKKSSGLEALLGEARE